MPLLAEPLVDGLNGGAMHTAARAVCGRMNIIVIVYPEHDFLPTVRTLPYPIQTLRFG